MVGRLAAQVLRGVIRDGTILGIGDGVRLGGRRRVGGRRHAGLGDRRPPGRRLLVAGTGARAVPSGRRGARGQAVGLMAPGLVDDGATMRSREAHAGVRSILEFWQRLDVALFGIGGRGWSAASVGQRVEHELDAHDAVGEVLIAPYDLDGAFVCAELRERAIAFDARGLVDCPSRSGWQPARARWPRSSGPCGRASSGTGDRRRDGRGRRRPRPGDARRCESRNRTTSAAR